MDVSLNDVHRLSTADVRLQLERMVRAVEFAVRPRAARMLRFFVEESIRTGFAPITQRVIATQALGLDEDFNPTQSALVRVNVSRLRRAIELYFAGSGRHDPVVFELTPGPYRILGMRNTQADPDDLPPQPPREVRRSLPLLLFVEPDGQDLDEATTRLLGPHIGLRVTSQFVESTLVMLSGPLSRDRLTALAAGDHRGPAAVATVADSLGYDFVADCTLCTTDGRWCPQLSIIDAGTGAVIKHAADPLGPFADPAAAAQGVADWIIAALVVCFSPPPPLFRGVSQS